MSKKVWWLVLSVLVVGAMLLAACTPETIVETVVVTSPAEPGETIIVTATPVPPEPVEFNSADPNTYVTVSFGDVDTLDPAWNYESVGDGFLEDIYDQLVAYDGPDASAFVPELATSWDILDDGTTYVFHIREGVTFHDGAALTPEDVAYTFQRGLLQGGYWSPQWLYTEAFFGTGVYDIAELVNPDVADDAEGLQAEDPALLLETCELVTSAIVADEAAGTVTFYLDQAWGPLLSTLAGSWGSVTDKDWAIANGAWDGDCATWQNYYGISSEDNPLRDIANGTGPYVLDHWTPGEEFVMVANQNYWLAEPLWEGGPSGVPAMERVVYQIVDEWGTRFAMLQAGDADTAAVPRENVVQVEPLVGEQCTYIGVGEWDCAPTEYPDAPLRLWSGHPLTSRTDAFFVFDINVEGGNPYVGSGEMDGNGIPPDFFSDIHVRRAFNYCFDWDAYIADALAGEAVQNYGPVNAGLIGYDFDAPHYTYDPDMCAQELQQAWDGAVWENGFRFQIAYNTGNVTRQTIAQILQANFADLDAKFVIEIIGLPWPSFLAAIRASRVPIFISGWAEDIHDPHNWAQPFLVGTYAHRQNMPEDMHDEFAALVSAGVAGATTEERAAVYAEIQLLDYEYAPAIRLAVPTGRRYEQRWVQDWYYNPMVRGDYYAFSKE